MKEKKIKKDKKDKIRDLDIDTKKPPIFILLLLVFMIVILYIVYIVVLRFEPITTIEYNGHAVTRKRINRKFIKVRLKW